MIERDRERSRVGGFQAEEEVLPSTFYRFDSYEAAVTKSGRLLYVAVVDPVDSDSGLERWRAVPVFAVMSLCNFACIVYYLKKKQSMAVVIADAAQGLHE